MGTVLGPNAHTTRAPRSGQTGHRALAARPKGRAARGTDSARHQTPLTTVEGQPPKTASHQPRGTQPLAGHASQMESAGPVARTPAPTAGGQQTPTARPEGGQPGEDERLTSYAPHNSTRRPPPRGRPPATSTARNAGSQERTLWGGCWVPHAHTTRARDTRVMGPLLPAPRDGRPGEGQRQTPDTHPNGGRPSPPGGPPTTAAARSAPQGMQAKGTVLDPHTRTPVPTASGQRTPTACPEGGQPGEDKRLTPDAAHNGGRHPPRGRPLATPTARNATSQDRTLWGRCWVLDAHTTRARDTRAMGRGCPPPGTGGRERDSA